MRVQENVPTGKYLREQPYMQESHMLPANMQIFISICTGKKWRIAIPDSVWQTLLQLHTDKQIQKCLPFSAMANNTSDKQFSPNAKAVVDLAEHLALTSNSLFTGTEHLLQALLDSPCRYRRMFCCEIQYRSSIGGLPHPSPMMMTQLMLTFPQLSE